MTQVIRWSETALRTYKANLTYLIENWDLRTVDGFKQRVQEVLKSISENPHQYPLSNRGKAHRCVVTKHISLFYDIDSDAIQLLIFWDNRQHTRRLKY